MSQLGGVFRQIVKKANHPNILLHNIQLEHAKIKHLVQGQLGVGSDETALELGAPEEQKEKDAGQERTLEAKDRSALEGKSEVVIEVKGEDNGRTEEVGGNVDS
jgi:hypothetical protein